MLWILLAVLLAASVFYSMGILLAAVRHALRRDPAELDGYPPVSVFKPLHGAQPGLEQALASHFQQDYPEHELVACAAADDPALEAWSRASGANAGVSASHCEPPPSPSPNRKVGKLERLASAASHNVFLITDADVSVPREHLRRGAAELDDEANGVVTALYRAQPNASWASHAEALWVTAELQARFLLSTLVGGLRFAFGASMLVRRRDVDAIGGFEAIREYLADDFQLGNRIHRLGKRIVLSRDAVTTGLGATTARGVWAHQVRWARTIRISQFWGYLGLIVAQGSLWSMLALAWPGGPGAVRALALVCLAMRLAAGFAVGWGVLRSQVVLRYVLLLPLVDLLASAVWIAGMFGSHVVWQGRRIRVRRDGRIEG